MRAPFVIVVATGFLLHIYMSAFKAQAGSSLFAAGLIAYSMSPYFLATVLARYQAEVHPSLGFALGALAGDFFMYYSVFMAPTSSTAALGFLFMPLWNLVLLGPVGAFLAWVVVRLIRKLQHQNAA